MCSLWQVKGGSLQTGFTRHGYIICNLSSRVEDWQIYPTQHTSGSLFVDELTYTGLKQLVNVELTCSILSLCRMAASTIAGCSVVATGLDELGAMAGSIALAPQLFFGPELNVCPAAHELLDGSSHGQIPRHCNLEWTAGDFVPFISIIPELRSASALAEFQKPNIVLLSINLPGGYLPQRCAWFPSANVRSLLTPTSGRS